MLFCPLAPVVETSKKFPVTCSKVIVHSFLQSAKVREDGQLEEMRGGERERQKRQKREDSYLMITTDLVIAGRLLLKMRQMCPTAEQELKDQNLKTGSVGVLKNGNQYI